MRLRRWPQQLRLPPRAPGSKGALERSRGREGTSRNSALGRIMEATERLQKNYDEALSALFHLEEVYPGW